MKRNKFIKWCGIAASLFFACSAHAQLSNTLYYNSYNPRQHKVNPAFQPECKFYVGMPGLSTIGIAGGNSRFTFDDIFQNITKDGQTQTVLFLDRDADGGMENFINKLKFKERVYGAYQIDLIDFGFRMKHNNFLTVSLSNRAEVMAIVPKQIPQLFFVGMTDSEDYDFKVRNLSASATLFTELNAGYSQKINDKLNVGGAIKILVGHDNLHTDLHQLDLVGSDERWYLEGDANVYASLPGVTFETDEEGRITDAKIEKQEKVKSYLKPKGGGIAFDLGASYQLLDNLQLSASVQDLGFIRWSKELSQIKKVNDFEFTGITYDINENDDFFEKYKEEFDRVFTVEKDPKPYTTALCAKLNVGAEYSLFDNKLGLGILSKTFFYRKTAWEQFLLSANYRPSRWVSLTATYGMFDGEWNNFGLGTNFNLGAFNLNLAVDNIPLRYAKVDDNVFPSNTRNMRVLAGIAFVFRDKEKKVRDKDGDGVPNKLDKCPNTPIEARGYVDANGCPKDSDNDGVPDYLDRCPNTPLDLVGSVDSLGCPMDSDNDGVGDYLDKCPETSLAIVISVDTTGCPMDSDGDGVADYLDRCPNTPVEARGYVDEYGCPIDSDIDGVPDYMDKCPNEPGVSANGGCPAVEVEAPKTVTVSLGNVQFPIGKSFISNSSYTILNKAVKMMKEKPEAKLIITGHSDATGSSARNQVLSEERADQVKSYIIKKGVEKERITTSGKGDTTPIDSNETEAGRAKNRRATLDIEYQQEKAE